MFKKIFSLTILVLITVISVGQTTLNFTPFEYTVFKSTGEPQCGVGNVFCTIYRSNSQNTYKNYTYTIYLSSNSYFTNCNPTRTYVSSIEIFYLEPGLNKYVLPRNFFPFWVTVGETSVVYTFFHPNPNLYFHIKMGNIEPTIY